MTPRTICLTGHGHEVAVWPDLGGRIAAFRQTGGPDWLQPIPTDIPLDQAVRRGGCYPLAPYSNRIEAATFSFDGRTVALNPHPVAAPHAMHGVAWNRPFQCTVHDETTARLVLNHPGDGDWPWSFELVETLVLGPHGLSVTLQFKSTDDRPQPVGLGFHPYFPNHGEAHLRFTARHWWHARADRIPLGHQSIPDDRNFNEGRIVPRGLDDVYGEVGGQAVISWPAIQAELHLGASANLDQSVVFSPPDRPYFCYEPVTHPTNSHNMPGRPGLVVANKNDFFQCVMDFHPARLC